MSFPIPHSIREARANEAGELFTLQRAAYTAEAQSLRDPFLPQLVESLEDVARRIAATDHTVLVAITNEEGEWGHRFRLIGSVHLHQVGEVVHFTRLVIAPDLVSRGIGSTLLTAVISFAERSPGVSSLSLDAEGGTSENLAIYRRFGFADASGRDARGLRILTRAC